MSIVIILKSRRFLPQYSNSKQLKFIIYFPNSGEYNEESSEVYKVLVKREKMQKGVII